ncbi:hypothetical protein CAC42_1777 [Sphaceloma murrayae]|uniref:DUF1746 domain-containing protein n=1 Tax=Sphaceloma murrayae TaxID=2082308 RepID=A0A2K1QVF5_9PEZI|nr:hypothetical protein CAC42_1777 [Sphaceloma murrayae]
MPNDPIASTSPPQPSTSPDAAPTRPSRIPKPRHLFNARRATLLTDLIRSLDLLVYAELSAIYYMDVSFLRLLLRCMLQFTFLTPKPAIVPEPPSAPSRPVVLIVFANLLCAVWHAYFPAPEAGEATRGYLHGGLAMDFIGQKGGTYRAHLVGLDLLVLGLQVFCLGAVAAKKRAKEGTEGMVRTGSADEEGERLMERAEGQASVNADGLQTVEFEERGQLASENREGDVELRDLNRNGRVREEDDDGEEEERAEERRRLLVADREGERRGDRHIFDAFNSGEIVVADLSLARILKHHFRHGSSGASSTSVSNTDVESGTSRLGGSGIGWRMRIGGRNVGV